MKEKFKILWISPYQNDEVARCAVVKRLRTEKEFCCQIAKPIGSKNKEIVIHPCNEYFAVKSEGAPAMCNIDKEYCDLCVNDILTSQFDILN